MSRARESSQAQGRKALGEALRSGKILLMDGAMGTELRRRGLLSGECTEQWNLTRPADVRAVHRSYWDAGAKILLTNTFQANPQALAKHGLQDQLAELWQAALAHARLGPMVLAAVGPAETFEEQAITQVLDAAGPADGLLLETWSSVPHLLAFARLNREGARLPLLVSFTFRRTGELVTWSALTPEACAEAASQAGAVALGVNCGAEIDLDAMLEIVQRYRSVCDLPLFARPNAGTPVQTASGSIYSRSPEALAAKLRLLLAAGVTMVGGCCGTTPAHIAAFRRVVDAWDREQH